MMETVLLSELIHQEREALGGRTSGDLFVQAILYMFEHGKPRDIIIDDHGWNIIMSVEGDGILIRKNGKRVNDATLRFINAHPQCRSRNIHGEMDKDDAVFTWKKNGKH